MCGIVGYVGRRSVVPILLDGLRRLEYRGYDSSGIGVVSTDGRILVRKAKGKIRDLASRISEHPLPEARIGVAHTRWATHGAPNQTNAHPHWDCSRRLLVVHNGIIENYEVLKDELRRKGHRFRSQTDTEVIAHLIEAHDRGDLRAAVLAAIRRVRGAFAIGVLSRDHPDRLIAARVGSPLVLGAGRGESFIASDVPAILDAVRRVVYLEDGELAELRSDGISLYGFDGRRRPVRLETVSYSVDAVRKQGYPHFMLKEIHEQPEVLGRLTAAAVRLETGGRLEGLNLSESRLRGLRRIVIVACGTAYHAGLVGRYVIERLTGIPVTVDVSSEFRYRDPLVDRRTLVVAVSQSGETADTLAAVREARRKGAWVAAVCNVVGSSLAREADGVLPTQAGPEIGVASTKAYTAQIAVLYRLAVRLGALHRPEAAAERRELMEGLRRMPEVFRTILKAKAGVADVARKHAHFGCFLFLGRNVNFPSALEGALKLKEISYIPAEGYAAGEMKHGPIALIDEYRAVVCLAPASEIYEKMISNMQEIQARRGKIIAIATRGDRQIRRHAHHTIFIPPVPHLLSPLAVAVPLQLLAYHIAVARGCDVDQPRNLAKSVTVE